MTDRILLQVELLPDGQVKVVHPEDEVIARYAVDKARAMVDAHFHIKDAVAGVTNVPKGDVPPQAKPRILPAYPGGNLRILP